MPKTNFKSWREENDTCGHLPGKGFPSFFFTLQNKINIPLSPMCL